MDRDTLAETIFARMTPNQRRREYHRIYKAKWREEMREAGICAECGTRPAAIGRRAKPVLRCAECNDKVIRRAQEWKDRHDMATPEQRERNDRIQEITTILLDGYDATPALRQHFRIKAGLIVDAEDRRNRTKDELAQRRSRTVPAQRVG